MIHLFTSGMIQLCDCVILTEAFAETRTDFSLPHTKILRLINMTLDDVGPNSLCSLNNSDCWHCLHVSCSLVHDVWRNRLREVSNYTGWFVSSRMKSSLMLRWTLNGIKWKKSFAGYRFFTGWWAVGNNKQVPFQFLSIFPLKLLPSVLRARSSLFPSTFVVQGTLTQ